MGLIYSDSLVVSECASLEPSSEDTLVSTSVDSTSTSPLSPIEYVAYVNHQRKF